MKRSQRLEVVSPDLFHVLDQRERVVIQHRIGFDGRAPKSLEEIGKLFGVTRERVRQIENAAAEKMVEARTKS